MEIKSTPRGYILTHKTDVYPYIGTIACKHYSDNMLDELYTIVDFGGTCIDVKIDHIIYGESQVSLIFHLDMTQMSL